MKRNENRDGRFVSVVLAAGGKGVRMGADVNKIFLDLAGEPIFARTVRAFDDCPEIDEIVVAAA